MNKSFTVLALSVMVLLIACQESTPTPLPTPVPTITRTFKIDAGDSREMAFDVQKGTVVEYSFKADLDFNFSVLDPGGNVVTRTNRVIEDQGQVRADRFGRYTLRFNNGFSLFASKTVTLTYRVVPAGGR